MRHALKSTSKGSEMDAMKGIHQVIDGRTQSLIVLMMLLALLFLFVGLNYRQLFTTWVIWNETNRLARLAKDSTEEFQNPEPMQDRFENGQSSEFWNFALINGGGVVSNENAWHAVEINVDHGLTIQHSTDPDFLQESSNPMQRPAAGRYNNATLIGGRGFRPTSTRDVVLQFTANVGDGFYGTAGVVVQPIGTIHRDGSFQKPFDMFGFAVVGRESSLQGSSGPLCYLALDWVPVQVTPLHVNAEALHHYEIRLRQVDRTSWLGILKVDDKVQCQMTLPAFGPLEVQVWSDNYLLKHQPRRWWEIASTTELAFQDGGYQQFRLELIRIFEKVR